MFIADVNDAGSKPCEILDTEYYFAFINRNLNGFCCFNCLVDEQEII